MAKLRKTLGGIDWPVCEALMRQIETQSTVTLSRWAVDHAAREYLPLCGEAPALTAAVEGCRKHLTGQLSLKELKPLLREASAAARDTEGAVEQAAALLFAAAKNIITADGKARSGNWNTDRQELVGYQIRDAVTGIIGLGSIGGRFAQIMKYGFNNRVIVYDPYLEDRKIRNMGYEPVSLEELLSQADFVSVHCSLNASTEKLIDAGRLKLMKRDAILVNTARGAIVDEMAVYEAVKNREIFAYAADAAAVEPIPADHPLCGIPHVIITPHSAIYNRTCMYQMNRKVMEDLYLMEAGKEPKGIVTE